MSSTGPDADEFVDGFDDPNDYEALASRNDYPEADRPVAVWCDPDHLHVRLRDGRLIVTPLWWYPILLAATPAQRNHVELMLDGVHWPDVDEDLSVGGMLHGRKAPGAVAPDGSSTDAASRPAEAA